MEELFYLRDSRSDVGSSAMFWAIKGGYTTDLSEAEKFSREKAVSKYNSRETDIPVRCDLADTHAYLAVDMQLLPDEGVDPDKNYLVTKRIYDGNNIRFVYEIGNGYCLSNAAVFDGATANDSISRFNGLSCYPASAIESIARPVVCADLIETKMVLRKAKIKMVKVKRYRQTKGLNRSNCPTCGRIVWDGNPYEAAYCKDHWRDSPSWRYAG